MPYLDIVSPQSHHRLVLLNVPVTIGRSPTNSIPIDDPQASRAHCIVEKAVQGYRLRDLDSRNGTWQNSEKVDHVILADQDDFQIGAVRFTFHQGDAPE